MYESLRNPKDSHQTGFLSIFFSKRKVIFRSKLAITITEFSISCGEFSLFKSEK